MGVLSAVLDAFRSKAVITLDATPATGEAQRAVSAMIAELRKAPPDEVRKSGPGKFEGVIAAKRLEHNTQILETVFGEPSKAFGVRAKFAAELADAVATIGGIAKNQCLYLRRFEDGRVAYAALWPWDDPTSITLKVGVFDDPIPPS